MYAMDPHESESETERESDPDHAMRTTIMRRGGGTGNNKSVGEIVVENGEIRIRETDYSECTEETHSCGSSSISSGSSDNGATESVVETAGGPAILPIRTTPVPIYSDPMVQEAAERLKRTDLEMQRALDAQREMRVGNPGMTTFTGVASALQDKYEQMVRQYRYDVGTSDTDAARYGYRFGSGNFAGREHIPSKTKYGAYKGAESIKRGSRKRKPWTAEESNRWLLQIVWVGLTVTLLMMMIMSASDGGRGMLRAHIATNTTNSASPEVVSSLDHGKQDPDQPNQDDTVLYEDEEEPLLDEETEAPDDEDEVVEEESGDEVQEEKEKEKGGEVSEEAEEEGDELPEEMEDDDEGQADEEDDEDDHEAPDGPDEEVLDVPGDEEVPDVPGDDEVPYVPGDDEVPDVPEEEEAGDEGQPEVDEEELREADDKNQPDDDEIEVPDVPGDDEVPGVPEEEEVGDEGQPKVDEEELLEADDKTQPDDDEIEQPEVDDEDQLEDDKDEGEGEDEDEDEDEQEEEEEEEEATGVSRSGEIDDTVIEDLEAKLDNVAKEIKDEIANVGATRKDPATAKKELMELMDEVDVVDASLHEKRDGIKVDSIEDKIDGLRARIHKENPKENVKINKKDNADVVAEELHSGDSSSSEESGGATLNESTESSDSDSSVDSIEGVKIATNDSSEEEASVEQGIDSSSESNDEDDDFFNSY
jgi:hypothetical protein